MGRPRRGTPPRREAILDAALAAFVSRGASGATMGEVAVSAGASKTTLYKMFPDIDRLFAAVLEREVARRRGAIAEALRAKTVEDALRGAAQAMMDALDDQAVDLFRLVIAEAGRRPEIGRGFYDSLVTSAARPVAERLHAEAGLCGQDAHRLALQFVGAIKEPLFYPRLMGAAPAGERDEVIEDAVAMACARVQSRQ